MCTLPQVGTFSYPPNDRPNMCWPNMQNRLLIIGEGTKGAPGACAPHSFRPGGKGANPRLFFFSHFISKQCILAMELVLILVKGWEKNIAHFKNIFGVPPPFPTFNHLPLPMSANSKDFITDI